MDPGSGHSGGHDAFHPKRGGPVATLGKVLVKVIPQGQEGEEKLYSRVRGPLPLMDTSLSFVAFLFISVCLGIKGSQQ